MHNLRNAPLRHMLEQWAQICPLNISTKVVKCGYRVWSEPSVFAHMYGISILFAFCAFITELLLNYKQKAYKYKQKYHYSSRENVQAVPQA